MNDTIEIKPFQQLDGSIIFNIYFGDIVIGNFRRNGSNFDAIFFGTRSCKRATFADRIAACKWVFSMYISH